MNCPDEQASVPKNRDKKAGRDTRARIRNRDSVPSRFPSRFASADVPVDVQAVSFLSDVEKLLAGEVLTPWQRAFVVGCRKHLDAGRDLSAKQVKVMRTLLDIASDAETPATLTRTRAFAQPHGER
jgi:hypothetical protein